MLFLMLGTLSLIIMMAMFLLKENFENSPMFVLLLVTLLISGAIFGTGCAVTMQESSSSNPTSIKYEMCLAIAPPNTPICQKIEQQIADEENSRRRLHSAAFDKTLFWGLFYNKTPENRQLYFIKREDPKS